MRLHGSEEVVKFRVFVSLAAFVFFSCAKSPARYHRYARDSAPSLGSKTATPGSANLRKDIDFGSQVYAEITWITGPKVSSRNQFTLTFFEEVADGSQADLVLESLPSLKLWMPSMGHGSTEDWSVEIAPPSPSDTRVVYQFNDVNLFMAGVWELKLTALLKGKEMKAAPEVKI